jgi:pseudaminic acid synthase
MSAFEIEGVGVGGKNPCRTIAEVSNNHGGSLGRASSLIASAHAAGCDFVKFQAYTPDELIALRGDGLAPEPWGAQGWTVRALYEKARTPLEWFPDLFGFARELGIVPFASFFGHESFATLRSVDSPAYKLASLDRDHVWLRDLALSSGKPVIASVPDRWAELPTDVAYLRCPPGYPQSGYRLSFEDFHDQSDCGGYGTPFAGFSYHGTEPRACYDAAVLGARMLEFHFMHAHQPGEFERDVSLTQHQAHALVADIRAMEARRAL